MLQVAPSALFLALFSLISWFEELYRHKTVFATFIKRFQVLLFIAAHLHEQPNCFPPSCRTWMFLGRSVSCGYDCRSYDVLDVFVTLCSKCLQSNNLNSQKHFLKLESLRWIFGCIKSSLLRFFWEPRRQRWRLGLVVFLLNTFVHSYIFFLPSPSFSSSPGFCPKLFPSERWVSAFWGQWMKQPDLLQLEDQAVSANQPLLCGAPCWAVSTKITLCLTSLRSAFTLSLRQGWTDPPDL